MDITEKDVERFRNFMKSVVDRMDEEEKNKALIGDDVYEILELNRLVCRQLEKDIPEEPNDLFGVFLCAKCGSKLCGKDDTYCKKCGQKVRWNK